MTLQTGPVTTPDPDRTPSPTQTQEDAVTTAATPEPSETTLPAPDASGYADVNGLHLYWESYGEGPPLVLLHGGVLTIELNWASVIPELARNHRVIGVEAQGHGRTADIDRPFGYPALASDVVGLLDHLGLERATVIGHSMGAGTTLELLVSHRDRLSGAVAISGSVRREGMHPDLSDPSTFATSPIMPTAQDFAEMTEAYQRLSPHPERFETFMQTLGAMDADFAGWSDEQLGAIDVPVLIVQGDNDFTLIEHAAFMRAAIPGSTLAVFPDTTHMQVTRRADLLLPVLHRFLDGHGL